MVTRHKSLFGGAVALSGNNVMVGDPEYDIPTMILAVASTKPGAAFIYELDTVGNLGATGVSISNMQNGIGYSCGSGSLTLTVEGGSLTPGANWAMV